MSILIIYSMMKINMMPIQERKQKKRNNSYGGIVDLAVHDIEKQHQIKVSFWDKLEGISYRSEEEEEQKRPWKEDSSDIQGGKEYSSRFILKGKIEVETGKSSIMNYSIGHSKSVKTLNIVKQGKMNMFKKQNNV